MNNFLVLIYKFSPFLIRLFPKGDYSLHQQVRYGYTYQQVKKEGKEIELARQLAVLPVIEYGTDRVCRV